MRAKAAATKRVMTPAAADFDPELPPEEVSGGDICVAGGGEAGGGEAGGGEAGGEAGGEEGAGGGEATNSSIL